MPAAFDLRPWLTYELPHQRTMLSRYRYLCLGSSRVHRHLRLPPIDPSAAQGNRRIHPRERKNGKICYHLIERGRLGSRQKFFPRTFADRFAIPRRDVIGRCWKIFWTTITPRAKESGAGLKGRQIVNEVIAANEISRGHQWWVAWHSIMVCV